MYRPYLPSCGVRRRRGGYLHRNEAGLTVRFFHADVLTNKPQCSIVHSSTQRWSATEMINVPDHVEDEDAYISAAMRRIANNARKGKEKKSRERMEREPEFAALIRFVHWKAEKGSKFFVQMVEAIEQYGAMTEGQENACLKIMREEKTRLAEIRQRDAGSEHIGTVGKREIFTVTITGIAALESFYGDSFLHFMKDAAGNVVIYKGTKKLAEKGATVTIKATVKAHGERDGIKQTTLQRPVIEKGE
ncbi:hypothetical protein HMSP1_72 [Sinorhizobium phage HMSP1-Susan]|nr:hypothetical protein HMSP1_72 [Sinorhizobium phage HMSP1-Susan]